jgi:energy-coupling factor transporter ATP-binding protein EcfA2
MNAIIQIVPEIKRLSLTHVGCWKDLILDFTTSLNIITGMGGCGKSTILRSILQAVHPLDPDQYCLAPTYPSNSGRIGIEFNTKSVVVDIPALNRIHSEPAINESRGQFMLSQLFAYIGGAPQGCALLIEDEVTSCLDDMHYDQAVELLNTATSQIVCIIRNRFSLKDFPNARVYNCYVDANGIAQIKLQ